MINPHIHGKDPSACAGESGSYPLLCHLLDTAIVAGVLWDTRVRPGLRVRLSAILGVDGETVRRVFMLAAAMHDVGKANPFFQYQERSGASSDFAEGLQERLGLPRTAPLLREKLNADRTHPLRRHEFISHRIVSGDWAWGDDPVQGDSWLGILVGGHHGYWRPAEVDDLNVGRRGDELIAGWTAEHDNLRAHLEEVVGLRCSDVPPLAGPAALVPFVALSGLLTLADWIASDDERVGHGKKLWEDLAPHTSTEVSKAWMAARADEFSRHVTACLGPDAAVTRAGLNEAVLGSRTARPLQAEALDLAPEDDPGLWICMYPTGDGKTEAALLRGAVEPAEGFIFGLPTLATTDAMEVRLQESAGRLPDGQSLPIRKSHHHADRVQPLAESGEDEACGGADIGWYSAAIRKLVAPNVVCTVDQVLAGALARRHITLRLFGLANHHVILDEVHTYDEYQTELLIELLYWWGASATRVTLLSATLPSTHLRQMVQAYKAGLRGDAFESAAAEVSGLASTFPSTIHVSAVDGSHSVREPRAAVREPQPTVIDVSMSVRNREARIESHIAWARTTARDHPRSPIAVFTNVVADCATIAAALRADPGVTSTHEVLCLHSALAVGHRQSAERRLVERAGTEAHRLGFSVEAKPVLVVGTQVIQASLDFDVDFPATDLAPAADLIQRLGRAWRFEGSLPDVPFRGGRLHEGARRTLRVVPVVGDDETTSTIGDRPYLSAIQRRTLMALRSQIDQDPCVDVFRFSQPWVDVAYDKDPTALLSEQEAIVSAATQEVVHGLMRVNASRHSRAPLARADADGTAALLPARSKPIWRDLCVLSQLPDDEDLMQTRYIETQTRTVILIDTSGESFYWDAQTGEQVYFPTAGPEEIRLMPPSATLPLPKRLSLLTLPLWVDKIAAQAIEAGLGGRDWDPADKSLAHTPPLDLAILREHASYDPISGLMKKEEA